MSLRFPDVGESSRRLNRLGMASGTELDDGYYLPDGWPQFHLHVSRQSCRVASAGRLSPAARLFHLKLEELAAELRESRSSCACGICWWRSGPYERQTHERLRPNPDEKGTPTP